MFSERIGALSDSIVRSGVLGSMAATVLSAIPNAIWAGLAELHARGEHEVFNPRLMELTRLIVLLGVAGMAPIVAFNHQFVTLWVGSARDGGIGIGVVTAANGVLLTLGMLYSVVFVSTGRLWLVARRAAVSAVINLAATIILARA